MFGHILVPLDGSPLAAAAVPYAVTFARAFAARISLLGIVEPFPTYDGILSAHVEERDKQHLTACAAYLESVATAVRAQGLAVTTVVRHGNPAEEIMAYAEDEGCDLIAMSSHGRTGFARVRMGSVAQHVLRHAAVPTLIVRPHNDGLVAGMARIAVVTVTLDGSELAEEALPIAARIARALTAPLTLLRVIPTHLYLATSGWDGAYAFPATAEMERAEEQSVEQYLQNAATPLREPSQEVRTVWQRSPANEADEHLAARLAQQPAGLAVVASHGRGGVLRWVLGSTAEYLLDTAPCPILIVRAGQMGETEPEKGSREDRAAPTMADSTNGDPVRPDASPHTDGQAERRSPQDMAAEISHPHPHPVVPGHQAP